MSLKNTLNDNLKTAMKAREMDKVKVLRSFGAVIKQIEIDRQMTLDDAGVLELLQKQIKQRQESHDIFIRNDRQDLADKEQFEIDVLSQFMPTPLSDDELNIIITDTISELNATSMADMGKVMNAVKEKTVGRGDPSVISKLVKEQLK